MVVRGLFARSTLQRSCQTMRLAHWLTPGGRAASAVSSTASSQKVSAQATWPSIVLRWTTRKRLPHSSVQLRAETVQYGSGVHGREGQHG